MPAVRRSPCNSKTKSAQAPSAPPTILTDRCSDDLAQKVTQILEFFEGEVIRSREEARAAEEARVAAEKTKSDAKEAEERIRKRVQLFTTIHAKAVKCCMCGRCIDRPFTVVKCGHTFCYGCLKKWFHRCLLEQVGWRDIPAYLKEAPMTAAKLKELFEKKYIYMTWYTCPVVTCQVSVERKPIEVAIARQMIGVVNSILGAPTCQVDSNSLLQHPGNIWADVFYEDDLDKQYRHMFQSTVLSFTPSRLKFLPNHTTAAGAQPPLNLTDMRGSHSFMVHQQFMQKLLELVDAIDINGDDEVAVTRKKLILDIQEHRRYLDRLLDYEWLRQHAETTTSEVSGTSLPIVVNTMVLTP
ncbi:hypothetical protein EDD16DRAFT_1711074 [Pisolithus croceorrhizus]|nr:hypothetical protein EDD16DRAFT_1711074 [Pisolithus croceorrhizus]